MIHVVQTAGASSAASAHNCATIVSTPAAHNCATIVSTPAATPAADANFNACSSAIIGPRMSIKRRREKSSIDGSNDKMATPTTCMEASPFLTTSPGAPHIM